MRTLTVHELQIELEGKGAIQLLPNQAVTISRGVLHRPRALERNAEPRCRN